MQIVKKRFFKKLLIVALSLFGLGILTVAVTYLYIRDELPSVITLKDVHLQVPMKIYTKEGLLISQYGEKRRIPLRLDQMPQSLLDALIATEDSRFYQHPGIDIIGIVRSAIAVATTGSLKQGASTITMQLARNFFLTRDKTLIRKIKELFISLHIESLLSKDEILELYLNKIALGHRSFGVGAAAQVYYGKDILELNLAQIATIAGLPKAPSSLNPVSHPQRSKNRRAVVLGRMLAMKYITQQQYEEAKNQPVTASKHGADIEAPAPYVASIANDEMIRLFGLEDAYTKGYKVFTTVPAKLQFAAQQAVMNNLHAYDERHGYRGPESYLWPQSDHANKSIEENIEPQIVLDELTGEKKLVVPINEHAWDMEQIDQHLAGLKSYGQITPAVVVQITEKRAVVRLNNNANTLISWDNLKWARPLINDNKRGRQVKVVSKIFNDGALIWVRQQPDGQYRLAQVPAPSSALVALNPKDGAIRSIVGGYNYSLSQYNRAIQAKRQVGSNIKPLIYSAALEHGKTLASLINDAPIHQWDQELGVAWRPKNSPPQYDGPIRIRVALAKSKNVVSVRLLKAVGLGNIVDHIEKFGIPREEIPQNDSLALGSASLTPLQVAASIAIFANGGFLVEPYLIDYILDADGNEVYKANPPIACIECEQQQQNTAATQSNNGDVNTSNDTDGVIATQTKLAPRVISTQNAFLIAQAMTSTIWGGGDWSKNTGWNGTGFRAQKLKRRDMSGKTGTTNDAKDTWFSGFTPKLMVTTWVGFDNPSRALGRVSAGAEAGARTAQPAWIEYMKTALKDI
ncbi:MAG: penicillin-binding protein 1A, partial [Phenylobacterium sp.]